MINEHELPEIQRQAINWLVLMRSDTISDDDLYGFADWLAADPAHSEAFAKAEDLFGVMLAAADVDDQQTATLRRVRNADGQSKIKRNRRLSFKQGFTMTFLTLAAVWFFAVLLFWSPQTALMRGFFNDYYTKTGELKKIELSDGSELVLDTNTSVSVHFAESSRQVTLSQGQVNFNVFPDTSRPFVVLAGPFRIQALGTEFQVHKYDSGDIRVVVREHAVAVENSRTGNSQSDITTVEAGQQIWLNVNGTSPKPIPADLNHAIAWQNQQLIVNDRPLSELIGELERYRNGRIFLADADLANLHVTGVFSLTEPNEVIHSVAEALTLNETWIGPWWVVLGR